ncbi:flagellar protein FlgN [Massilia sp. G4R7]|uniref:Flagellar protein FlgN n=1 Tax=Massilia phyllostachyos TaxID=2898585 RepID=A0ABS8Q6U5_9BURK|nr:flagellar export chaperone FlgN [Massilia phyllostachyos]MCD2517469.1 flagellar protein FlgN [Massilia phyllostachyos]
MNAPSRLTRQQAQSLLADGVQADVRDSAEVLALLERQFEAALRHRSGELTQLAGLLSPLLDAMEARRQQRVSLVRALLGPDGTMAQYIAAQPAPAQADLKAAWSDLERTVQACKEATARNGGLLAEQYGVMQRVLHGEDGIYAPR